MKELGELLEKVFLGKSKPNTQYQNPSKPRGSGRESYFANPQGFNLPPYEGPQPVYIENNMQPGDAPDFPRNDIDRIIEAIKNPER